MNRIAIFTFGLLAALSLPSLAIADDKSMALYEACMKKMQFIYPIDTERSTACNFAREIGYEKFDSCITTLLAAQKYMPTPKKGTKQDYIGKRCWQLRIVERSGDYALCFEKLHRLIPEHYIGISCNSDHILDDLTRFATCFEKIDAVVKDWSETHNICNRDDARKDPDAYLKNKAAMEACVKRIAFKSKLGTVDAGLNRECEKLVKIGDSLWQCVDALRAERVKKWGRILPQDIEPVGYWEIEKCQVPMVREMPEKFLQCSDTLVSQLKAKADGACSMRIVRDNPALYAECVKTLGAQYAEAESTRTCTVPSVLKDPKGFLKRNPGKALVIPAETTLPQTDGKSGRGEAKK
jgi:hypothetical protein